MNKFKHNVGEIIVYNKKNTQIYGLFLDKGCLQKGKRHFI
jgi:hypothetical protein